MEKDLNYWKENAEEDYMQVPISVLKYISELENVAFRQVNKSTKLADLTINDKLNHIQDVLEITNLITFSQGLERDLIALNYLDDIRQALVK